MRAEARAVEDAVMANLLLHQVLAARVRNVGRERVRRLRLADAGDVVVLALNCHQRRAVDGGRIDRLVPVHHRALGQSVLDEDRLDRLQVELGGQVHDRKVLVIELAMLLGGIAVALDQMLEELAMRRHVPVEVHGHEAAQLQEAGIDPPQEARMRPRHLHDDAALEPVDRLALCHRVDGGGIDARVDGPAHQHHGGRGVGMALGLHARDGGEHGHGGLAHRHHMRVRPHVLEDLDDVVDVVVEVEAALGQRHHARIAPVGDVHLGMRQHRLHRAAQERGVVARHGRDDQELGVISRGRIGPGRRIALEMDEVAKRARPDSALAHDMLHAVEIDSLQPELGLGVAPCHALEQFGSGRDLLGERRVGERVGGVAPGQARGIGHGAKRRHRRVVHLVQEVVHAVPLSSRRPR